MTNDNSENETDQSKQEDGTPPPEDLWYPSQITPLSSSLGQKLLSSSSCSAYHRLIPQYEPQERFDFCGIACASIILNTFRPTDGWNQEKLYSSVAHIEKSKGMTLEKLAEVLQVCGVLPNIKRCNDDKDEDQFREDLTNPNNLVIINYWRQYPDENPNHTYRGGHFSPVGAYHSATDQVLIMETSLAEFPLHWVSVTELVRMMRAKDEASDAPRGYLIIVDGESK